MTKDKKTPTTKVTRTQKAFLDKLIEEPTITQTEAYIQTHKTNSKKTASVEATKTLKKPSSIIYLQKHIDIATNTIIDIAANGEKDSDRIKAAQDILDRTQGKAITKQITENTNLNVNAEINDQLASDFLKFMKAATQQQ